MTDVTYKRESVELLVRDREKLTSLKDKDFEDDLDNLVGWVTNLYRLHAVDPTEVIKLYFPTDDFIKATKSMKPDSDEFFGAFCETMESLLLTELEKRHIDLGKLHYGIKSEKGIKYEYCHISPHDYKNLLSKHKDKWYKVICVVPYKQVHRDIFFVPQSRLHDFFNEGIYKCYDGHKRRIVHIEPITKEEAEEEIRRIREKIKRHEKEKFRSDEVLQKR